MTRMISLTVMIAEDEPPARLRLLRLLERLDGVEVIGQAGDGREALEMLEKLEPDVLLLDVQMPGLDGLRLVEALDDPPAVIFTTAHEAHAVRAFELEAVDYLLKPFSGERLARALDRVRERLRPERERREGWHRQRIPAEEGQSRVMVDPNDLAVAWIEEGVVFLGRTDGAVLTYPGSLQEIRQALDSEGGFVQISRRTIVQAGLVERMTALGDGRLRVELKGGHETESSRRRSRHLRALFRL